ncbi:uncharacterized protein BDCG_02138 [Blastomyces dermatitidis ER-3]|uniref:Uncharacterized protein n=3 Tax=Blastomyces TaxID=229219 RepID=A0A179UKG3_BLAGS|nr:uncharacterized protein BDBG_03754 [Blastomyces gilchristii SLH14081]XP_045274432.1 uncharacterized protein BDCG_02138 [Blastomyces dermatitidis ER-3]EQL33268.1 hypothetical protein BDFG_04705 [Blastomyces dermatitidis ATCC 26199]KMW67119.1 hypothetical protein BDDG_11922 [Blastomyces dermatitidis ATCC 18188]EEQ87018.2 hypothetical protein BDCG_02138 [Blastomyces dermatitidis ER-3]OAT07718.1 hypothetical protein BDBG_03754 [Blastomyces gilchristii SLH14081]
MSPYNPLLHHRCSSSTSKRTRSKWLVKDLPQSSQTAGMQLDYTPIPSRKHILINNPPPSQGTRSETAADSNLKSNL